MFGGKGGERAERERDCLNTYFYKEGSAFHSFSVTLVEVKTSHGLAVSTAREHQPLRRGSVPRSGELRTQKLKSHLVRRQSLNVLPLKPGVDKYIAIHATLTAGDFFLAYLYLSGPFTCTFFFVQNLSRFFPVLAVANSGSCVGPQNKIGHPAGGRLQC